MKEIKTIVMNSECSELFDKAVNKALKEGWILVERLITQAPDERRSEYKLVAFLEREKQE